MKKRLHGGPEALVSSEAGDTQTDESTEMTSDPQSTPQVEGVELNQGRCNIHSNAAAAIYDLPHVICIVVLPSLC